MLIKALCDYADKLEENSVGNTLPDGFSEVQVHFKIRLTKDGNIGSIVDLRKREQTELKNGKTKTTLNPYTVILPERSQKTSIFSNIIEHRPLYIFGLNYDKGELKTTDKTGKAEKSHADFVQKNLDFFKDIDSDICRAYCNFIEKWKPEEQTENPHLKQLGKDYAGSYFCFGLDGDFGALLEEDTQFRKRYSEYLEENSQNADSTDEIKASCAVYGDVLPIARIHDKIKFPGGNTTGCVLVGMKEPAYESYGKTQSYNSNISGLAMKKYTSALNMLLSSKNHHITVDDTVIVYFAMKHDDSAECDMFSALVSDSSDKAQGMLDSALHSAKSGFIADYDAVGADPDVMFYIVGLSPNSSRICQKFIYRDKFGKLFENLIRHQTDMKITEDSRQVYFSTIAKQLVSPISSKDKIAPPLLSAIMLSAFKGTMYPRGMLDACVRRVKTDSDTDKSHFIKLNDTRAGIIKACLNRKARLSGEKEEIKMSLDCENKNPAYLCGRLFAVLEKIQQDSLGGNSVNRTIKDAFFASACSHPSTVFPRLLMLSQNHMRNLSDGARIYYQNLIGDIVAQIGDSFPRQLSLDMQGTFIIGYYQQNKALYTKKEN